MNPFSDFACHELDDGHALWIGRLPEALVPDAAAFDTLWKMHPIEHNEIKMHGRVVKIPRWQQAYGKDYQFSGATNKALPVPDLMQPLLAWTRKTIDDRLNGILVNWYDGQSGHYIGPHRDKSEHLVIGAPIVTLSFGEERTFRVRPWRGQGNRDFRAANGVVFVLPCETNKAFTHEVPASKRYIGKRISVTMRAFRENHE
jgi:alkylated DNA repair dioxygenase AlkB